MSIHSVSNTHSEQNQPPPSSDPILNIKMRLLRAGLCFLFLYTLLYVSKQSSNWSELYLIGLTLLLGLIILAPQVRSGLIRRRLFLHQWLHNQSLWFDWLRGGIFYVGRHFLISFLWALLILVELQHLHYIEHWIFLSSFGIAIGLQLFLFKKFKSILKEAPASMYAREWTMILIRWGLILILIPAILYLPRPDLSGVSFQEAITFSLPKSDQVAYGLFGFLTLFSKIKEDLFWWFILNYEQLVDLPPLALEICWVLLVGLYYVYSLSVMYAISRLISGLLELTDPYFYRFIRSKSS
jgi:hypothetical protein